MDSHLYNLHSNDIGWHMKHAKAISKDDEQKLWQSGVMGTSTSRSLQNAAFFVVGKMFCLGGGKEFRASNFSQVVTHRNPDRYEYGSNYFHVVSCPQSRDSHMN